MLLRVNDEVGFGSIGKTAKMDQLLLLQWFVAAVIKIHCWEKLIGIETGEESILSLQGHFMGKT